MAGDVEAVAEVSAALSQKSLDALSATIAKALDKGLKSGLKDFGKLISAALGKDFEKIQKNVSRAAQKLADDIDKVGTRGTRSLRGLTTGLGASNKETLKLVSSMEKLAQSQEVIGKAIEKAQSDFQQQTRRANQLTIERTRLTDRAGQAEIEIARDAARKEVVITQGAEQQKVVAARFAGQQRVQLTRAVIENIARLERGLAATLAGIARTAVGATGKAFGSISSMFGRGGSGASGAISSSTSSFTSSIKRMNSEMNRDLATSLTRRERTLQSSFSRQETIVSRSALRQSQTLEKLRRQTSTGVLGAATGRGVGPGLGALGAGAGIGALLISGFQRFSELERLNKQFLALTGNAEKAALLMAQVKEFAKLTPFDLVGVAGLAKGFLAIGTATEDVMPQVKAIADAVALTGGGVEQLDRIQRAIGQVVSTGKLQGDELNQLAESLPGLNIRKILAEQLTGGDVAKLVEMQAAGEITGELFVDGLITGLQQDKRLVGASEDLAKTLGGIAANTKESFSDLGASIIGLFSGQLKLAFKGAQTVMQGLANFIKGENLTAGLEQLRTALGGMAIGLAAVAAAKGGVEVLGLLADTMTALITSPFFILATTIALLGGAIALALKNSLPFRAALEGLGERVSEVAGRIGSFVSEKLAALSSFVTQTLTPALIRLADWIGANLLGAVDASIRFIENSVLPTLARWARTVVRDLLGAYRLTVDFIKREVIPRVAEFVTLLRTEVFPVVADVARAIASGFMSALGVVKRFGLSVWPIIKPAVDAFVTLGKAIWSAMTGDFSGFSDLGNAALGALKGIGSALRSGWDAAFEALRPLAAKALDIIRGVFTLRNLQNVFGVILDAVEWIGRTLGTIVSHPAFIAALASIAAAAVQLGVRFIKGFVEGVLSNIPTLFRIVKDLLIDNWKTVLLAAVIGVGFLAPLVRAFRQAGAAGGAGYMAGFRASMAGAGQFNAALFGGARAALMAAGLRSATDMQRSMATMQSRLAIFGVQRVYDPNTSGLRLMQRDLRLVNNLLPEATRRGLMMREGLRSIGQVIGSIFKGPAALGASWKNFIAVMKMQVTEGGRTIGAELAHNIASGLAIGFAGFTTGKMMGQAGQSPVMAILTGAFTGFMLSGGNLIGAGVGALAAGIGQAIGESSREAKEAKDRIKDYAAAISGDLKAALEEGTVLLVEWNDLLAGGSTGDFSKNIREQLKGMLSTLNEQGFTSQDVIDAISGGPESLAALLSKLDAGSGLVGAVGEGALVDAIKRAAAEAGIAIEFINAGLRDAQMAALNERILTGFSGRAEFEAAPAAAALKEAQAATREFYTELKIANRAWDDFGGGAETATAKAAKAIRKLTADDTEFFWNLRQANAAWDSFGDGLPRVFPKQLGKDVKDVGEQFVILGQLIDNALRGRDTSTLAASIRDAILGSIGAAGALNFDGLFDDLELSALKDNLISKLGPIFTQAVTEGWKITPESFEPLKQQFFTAFMSTVEDPDGKIAAAVMGILDDLQEEIKNNPLAFGRLFDQAVTDAETGGDDIAEGLVGGYIAGMRLRIDSVRAAAGRMAMAAVNAAASTLGIESPSKVFQQIGEQIGEGLEIGIEDSVSTVGDKMADAIRSAVDHAVEAAKGGTAALRSAGSSLFAALTGSTAPLGGGAMIGQIGGWTKTLQGFLEAAASTASRAFDVALKKSEGEEPLSPAESNIFGESPFSLNLADVLGAENVDALKGALDTIAGFGSEMLELGLPASDVVERLKEMRDQLLFTSGALGFNVDEVRSLVDSLGLSDVALSNFVFGLDSVTAAAAAAADAAKLAALSASMPGGLSNMTPGGMTTDEAKRIRSLTIEALTLSAEDLGVFMREHGLDRNFLLNLNEVQKDLADNTRDETEDLGRIFGLWGSSLASFVDDIDAWLTGLKDVVAPPSPQNGNPQVPPDDPDAEGTAVTHLPRPPINVNIYPLYGDPYAIGLSAVNAVAMAAMLPGS